MFVPTRLHPCLEGYHGAGGLTIKIATDTGLSVVTTGYNRVACTEGNSAAALHKPMLSQDSTIGIKQSGVALQRLSYTAISSPRAAGFVRTLN